MDNPSSIASQLRCERMSPRRSNGKEKTSNGGSSIPSSPEFEFWSMLRNPAAPNQTGILTADELFSDGVLLPLELLSLSRTRPSRYAPGSDQQDVPSAVSEPVARPGPPPEPATGSKRWTDIFKKTDKKSPLNDQAEDGGTRGKEKEKENKEKLEKERRKKKRIRGGSGSPELNINIWPFSRSRSAGNGGTRPVIPLGAPATRKASSAPCSRSNSAGESKSLRSGNVHKWPSSPGRVGVHVGRSSPIWQPRRGGAPASGSRRSADCEPVVRIPRVGGGVGNNKKDGYKEIKARVLNLNVPANIASGAHLGCGSVAGAGDTSRRSSGGGVSLFNLRGLFTRKVH